MIDPFPSKDDNDKKYCMDSGLWYLIPEIIGALREQSLFKTQDIIDSLCDYNYLKYLIFPSKSGTTEPLHCATLGAFGGFLHKSFREHDYELGRRNTQQFLRKHFVMPYSKNEDENNPIYKEWTNGAISNYRVPDENSGITYLPIIPDVQKNDVNSEIKKEALDKISKKFPSTKLKELEEPLSVRIEAAINEIEKMIIKDISEAETDDGKVKIRKNVFARIIGSISSGIKKSLYRIIISLIKKNVKETLVKKISEWIKSDLDKAGLFDA
jgi:hypothetical protein